jgi:hypothetical protein
MEKAEERTRERRPDLLWYKISDVWFLICDLLVPKIEYQTSYILPASPTRIAAASARRASVFSPLSSSLYSLSLLKHNLPLVL